jgi:hypothetical protein
MWLAALNYFLPALPSWRAVRRGPSPSYFTVWCWRSRCWLVASAGAPRYLCRCRGVRLILRSALILAADQAAADPARLCQCATDGCAIYQLLAGGFRRCLATPRPALITPLAPAGAPCLRRWNNALHTAVVVRARNAAGRIRSLYIAPLYKGIFDLSVDRPTVLVDGCLFVLSVRLSCRHVLCADLCSVCNRLDKIMLLK